MIDLGKKLRIGRGLAVALLVLATKASWGYWQQDVHYQIEAEFFPKEDKIRSKETLTYTNNSPDTLRVVYFHLYLNAFQPGSPMDLDNRKNLDFDLAELPPKEWGRMDIKKLEIAGKESKDYRIDFSILEIKLPKPLLPGKKLKIYFEFEDQIPPNGARMGKQGNHYDIGQWYPKIAVYDRFGWHADQYAGTGEFYGDFGKFEVTFTAPKKYLLGHTGLLSNQKELFPDLPEPSEDTVLHDVLKKLEEKKDTTVIAGRQSKGGSDKSELAGDSLAKEETRTWKMEAENVHDFFITANPDFIWDRIKWKHVTINTLYTEDAKETWNEAAEETRFCLKFLSETLGEYPYTQFTSVAGAVSGGMEYPQIITMNKRIDNKPARRFFAVLAHEVAHNWFYGLLGSNETRQACMDEGFTSFATTLAMESRYGRLNNFYQWDNFIQKTFYSNDDERRRNIRFYLQRANQKREEPIDTHSDRFVDGRNYRVAVYQKTTSILFTLQYTIGDSLFDLAFKDYFKNWKWKHPYLDDFRQMMEKYYGQSLEWFFDQWFEKTWRVDYEINSVKTRKSDRQAGYLSEVKLKKNKEAIAPLDIHFKLRDGKEYTERIPAEVWLSGVDEYTASVNLPDRPVFAELNPDKRLLDLNRLNNTYYRGLPNILPRMRINYNYLNKYNPVPLDAYQFLFNPSLWYNHQDGLKAGVRLKGSYMEWSHNLNLALWEGAKTGRLHHDISWKEPAFFLGNITYVSLRHFYNDGRKGGSIGVEKDATRKPTGRETFTPYGHRLGATLNFYRLQDSGWLPLGVGWESGNLNFLKLYFEKLKPGRRYDQTLWAEASASFLQSDFDYHKIFASYTGTLHWWKSHTLAARLALGYADGSVALQDRFYLASASALEEFEDPWLRGIGTLPETWRRRGEVYLPGGGNVRGYQDFRLSGKKLLAFNFKYRFPSPLRLVPWKIPKVTHELNSITWEVFYDLGTVWDGKRPTKLADYNADLGLGLSYKIPYLDQVLGDNRVRFEFPFYLNKPASSENRLKFRWLFSLGVGVL